MDKAAEDLREATDRYFRVQAVAFVRRKAKGPADPGFEPLSDDELAVLEELVSAIEDVREAQAAWVAAVLSVLAFKRDRRMRSWS